MKNIVCLLCAVLCIFGGMITCHAEETLDCYCNENAPIFDSSDEVITENINIMYVGAQPFLRLRSTESTDQPYLDKMPYGSMVTVIATQINDAGEEWSLVDYNGQYGYCMTRYLTYEMDMPASDTCPLTMEEAFGTTLLRRGNKTPSYCVKNLQLCLIEGGFLNDDKGADGYFGRNTYKALCAFQKSQGMEQAGRAGETTKTRLWYLYADFLMENGTMQ